MVAIVNSIYLQSVREPACGAGSWTTTLGGTVGIYNYLCTFLDVHQGHPSMYASCFVGFCDLLDTKIPTFYMFNYFHCYWQGLFLCVHSRLMLFFAMYLAWIILCAIFIQSVII